MLFVLLFIFDIIFKKMKRGNNCDGGENNRDYWGEEMEVKGW